MATNSTKIPDLAYLKWPANASTEYVDARRALLEEEYALSKQIEKVAAQRRSLMSGPVLQSYTFEEGDRDLNSDAKPTNVTLAQVAKQGEASNKTLIVYHMMLGEEETAACPACSMFIDGRTFRYSKLNSIY